VRGDKTRLRQLLANLLGNAIKYSPGDASVQLTLAREGDQIVIEVVDHGMGIDAADCARLFDPFYQGRGGAIGGGMGLGLALVKAIAIAHGGEVDCHSDGPGEGATFRVRLPRLADQRLAAPVVQPARPRLPPSDVRRVILLVEDQEDNRELLGEALGEAGFEVAAAGTLREALDTLDRLRPNAAIVDISLPDGSGHAVAQRIRAMPDGHAIRIIAVTGHGRQTDRDAILAAGFDHHLVKPVSVDTLVHAIGT
jgi:CheY-like chemotaxis protein